MEISIKGSSKEITNLVLDIQNRQNVKMNVNIKSQEMPIEKITQTLIPSMRDLLEKV